MEGVGEAGGREEAVIPDESGTIQEMGRSVPERRWERMKINSMQLTLNTQTRKVAQGNGILHGREAVAF